jgi:uncharacterized protein YbbC (DUF1343 family)
MAVAIEKKCLQVVVCIFFFQLFFCTHVCALLVGADRLLSPPYIEKLHGKRIGLIANQTSLTRDFQPLAELLVSSASKGQYQVAAFFSPEHGWDGEHYAEEAVENGRDRRGIPIYSLHGKTRRPTQEMLEGIDLLIYDMQDVGLRSYTYVSTLFYLMEEAAKSKIPVLVLDRPNPLNGITVDGPFLEEKWRSFIGYIDVPLCHGMTAGELALYFNAEYQVGCSLTVVPMEGWKRNMSFGDTGLAWVPTSPHIPEPSSVFGYATTGLIGELGLVNIGIGYSLPFRLVGAPWIQAHHFAAELNRQALPGVHFHPFYFRPFFGRFAKEECQGVLILVTDSKKYLPVTTQYVLMGLLKTLYPKEVARAFALKKDFTPFYRACGTEKIFHILRDETYPAWKLRGLHQQERERFLIKRRPYLLY